MIIDDYVEITIVPANQKYWLGLGYDIPKVGGRANVNGHHKLKVKVSDLPPKSNVRVRCKCDNCHVEYTNRYARTKDFNFCSDCHRVLIAIGNDYGKANKGKSLPHMSGENHPRWNPDKKEFQEYANRVRWLTEKTYRKNRSKINPKNYPRTLCGIEGGYQLDHKISVKEGFDKNITPEEIASVDNLQMLTWENNRTKHVS